MSVPAADPSPERLGDHPTRSRSGGRGALAIGATVLGVALVGGGAYAAWSFLATDAQPAEALPAGTVGYLALDTDPGGGQKVEAYRTLRKFPALEEDLGPAGREDFQEVVVDALFEDLGCDLTFDDDVADWMGDRLALAAVPDADEVVPVVAVEVTDVAAAEDGLAALRDCADEELGWAFRDDFALIGPTEEQARSVAAAAEDATLADDSDFQNWTDEVGTGGIVTGYAAPDAGEHFLTELEDLEDLAGPGASPLPGAPTDPGAWRAEMEGAVADFTGAGLGVRFEDGSLVVSVAAGGVGGAADPASSVGFLVAGLPGTTGLALAFATTEGWSAQLLDDLGSVGLDGLLGGGVGLDLADVEALLGDGAALVADGSLDLDAFGETFDPRVLPVGLKVVGDEDEVGEAADRVLRSLGAGALLLGIERAEGVVAVGPNRDYLATLVAEGDLGEQERFRAVVPEVEQADGVLYVDLDAPWIASLDDAPEVAANLEPLAALGASSWTDADGVLRGRIVLSTD